MADRASIEVSNEGDAMNKQNQRSRGFAVSFAGKLDERDFDEEGTVDVRVLEKPIPIPVPSQVRATIIEPQAAGAILNAWQYVFACGVPICSHCGCKYLVEKWSKREGYLNCDCERFCWGCGRSAVDPLLQACEKDTS